MRRKDKNKFVNSSTHKKLYKKTKLKILK